MADSHSDTSNDRRALTIGGALTAVSALLIASPFLLGSGGPMKYVVAAGVIGACLGLSILLHATWDLLAARRFRKP